MSSASLWVGAVAYFLAGTTAGALLLAVLGVSTTILALTRCGRAGGLLAVAIAVSAWGSVTGLIPQVSPWDKVEHGVGGLLLLLVLVEQLRRVGSVWPPRRLVAVAWLAMVAVAVVWEGLESLSDRVVATNLSLGPADTVGDLVADIAGGSLAALAELLARKEDLRTNWS